MLEFPKILEIFTRNNLVERVFAGLRLLPGKFLIILRSELMLLMDIGNDLHVCWRLIWDIIDHMRAI